MAEEERGGVGMPITRGRVGKAPLSPLVAAAAVVVSFSWVDGRMNGWTGRDDKKQRRLCLQFPTKVKS